MLGEHGVDDLEDGLAVGGWQVFGFQELARQEGVALHEIRVRGDLRRACGEPFAEGFWAF